MIFFKIFGIEITFGVILSFVIGLVFGLLVFFLIYLYALVRSLNKKKKIKITKESDIDLVEIEALIKSYQDDHQKNKATLGFVPSVIAHSKDLSIEIAKKFYPNSKYPYAELTIDETIMVANYIIKRIDEILGAKIIRLFRKMTIAKIIVITKGTKKIAFSEATKGAHHVLSTINKALNIVNPVWWIRKAFIDTSVKIILNKIGLMVIGLFGEESYKIYSKRQYVSSTKEDVNSIYESIKKELDDEKK